VYTTIIDAQQLMHHSLVSPLRKQWRDRIVPTVKDEEERCRAGRSAELEEVAVWGVLHGMMDTMRELPPAA
jgi:hypothetical protein